MTTKRAGAGRKSRILPANIAEQLAAYGTLPFDEGSHLLKFRLPTSSYVQFQEWCGQNGLAMSTTVRGFVEILLEQADPKLPD